MSMRLGQLWPKPLPLVGMVHLLPLPGSPRWAGSMEEVVERALADGAALEAGGVDGVLVENYGDAPFLPAQVGPETVAAMAVTVQALRASVSLPVGVNVLRNDARSALGIAAGAGASFLRVNVHTGVAWTDQGTLEGRAGETLRLRRSLGSDALILADVHVKHAATPPGVSLEDSGRDTWERGLADVLVISGTRTGRAPGPTEFETLRRVVPQAPLWIGSGLQEENAATLLSRADGAIVGSAFQEGGVAGGAVEERRVSGLLKVVERFRRGGG